MDKKKIHHCIRYGISKKRLCLLSLIMFFSVHGVSAKTLGNKMDKKQSSLCTEIKYSCPMDQSEQPAMIYKSNLSGARPLLVALHTWSANYQNGGENYATLCAKKGWHLIYPDFRGPNWTPQALGSELMVGDIVAAVEYMKTQVEVDESRIYLIGGSGGGHAALLLAGRHPEIWAAVSAWCPISDVERWHQHHGSKGYGMHIEKACGGNPATDENARAEALKRSPITYLKNAQQIPVDIATGIHDGHTGSVPIDHSLNAYNLLAASEDRFQAEEIKFLVEKEAVPSTIAAPEQDKSYGKIKLHVRRNSQNVRVTIFEGGHQSLANIGIEWLAQQRKGKTADWSAVKVKAEVIELTK